MANARIIAVKALKIVRDLNIERKVFTGYEIFGYGKICVDLDLAPHRTNSGNVKRCAKLLPDFY
jgi:hypothetical protein